MERGYPDGMNNEIRQAVKQVMEKQGISQGKLAEDIGIDRVNLTRVLSGRSGKIPETWQKILERLNLELVVREKDAAEKVQEGS